MTKIKHRKANRTLLVVGEGPTEEVFLKYLKSLFVERGSGLSVTIRSATGGSPADIVRHTEKISKNKAYDNITILLDADITLLAETEQRIKKLKFILLKSEPCIEGLLLKILDKPVPTQSEDCKKMCTRHFTGSLLNETTYASLIRKELLETKRNHLPVLDQLLKLFS